MVESLALEVATYKRAAYLLLALNYISDHQLSPYSPTNLFTSNHYSKTNIILIIASAMQPLLMYTQLLHLAKKPDQNVVVEEDVELKPEREPETLLQDREQSTTEVPSSSSSDLSPIHCAGVTEESQYSGELESESASKSSRSDVESRVSNNILEDGGDSDKEAQTPVTSGAFTPDLFKSSGHRILANSFSSFVKPPGQKYSTRSVST